MNSRTASLRLQLIDSVSGPSKGVAQNLRNLDSNISKLGKGATPEVKRLIKQLEFLRKKSGAIDDFTGTRKGLKEVGVALKIARGEVTRLETALKSTTNPTKKLQQDLIKARAAVKNASDAFQLQKQSMSAAERAMRSYSVTASGSVASSQQKIRDQIAQTIRSIRNLQREEQKRPPRPPVPPARPGGNPGSSSVGGHLASLGLGATATNVGRNVGERSFLEAVNFNRVAAYQAALGDLGEQERSKLNRQAEKIGGDTRFSNVDVVEAQTTILQRGIRDTGLIMDLTQKVTDYALAMGVTLEEAADSVTGSALSKRVDLKDADAIGKFVDNLVWMAKNGGMSDEDVRQFIKYGGAPTTGAKLPDEYMAAMGMVLRRSGVRGDEAGVFARSAASKLVAPTKKGRDALAAMGIDYNRFTTVDAMNSDGIGILMKNNFGVRLTEEMKAAARDLMDNGEFIDTDTGLSRSVISDSGEFVAQMSEIMAPLFADKKGNIAAADAKALAKALSDYQKYSVDSVDATGLLDAIAASDPTLGNLNAFFTDKQGGRANMIFQQWPLFQEMLEKMRNTPGGVANKIGTAANSELYGDWTKLVGTFETTLTRIGQDFEGVTRPIINMTNSVMDGFLSLDKSTRQLIVAFGAAAATFAGFAAFRGLAGIVGRIGGGGAGAAGAAGGAAAGAWGGRLWKLLKFGGKRAAGPIGLGLTAYEAYKYADDNIPYRPLPPGASSAMAMDAARGARSLGFGGSTENLPGKTADDLYAGYKGSGGRTTQVNAPIEAPISVVLNGVMVDQVLSIVRTTAGDTARRVFGEMQSALDAQLKRSSQTQFGGIKPYGD